MVTRRSAGLVVFRRADAAIEVLLGHMGGPFWARRDVGAWSIPKGELEADEDPLTAARREFEEELGLPPPSGPTIDLGEVRQSGGKVVSAWAVEGDVDPTSVRPGTFRLEWPPRSGTWRDVPEVDRVAWFDVATASERIVSGQRELLARLEARIG